MPTFNSKRSELSSTALPVRLLFVEALRTTSALTCWWSARPYWPAAVGRIVTADRSSSRSDFSRLQRPQHWRIRFHRLSRHPLGTKRRPTTCSFVVLSKVRVTPQ